MADQNVVYHLIQREALTVASKLGTWVFYRLRDADNLEHVVGYMLGRIDDFERRRNQTKRRSRKRFLSDRVASWQRALRLVQRIRTGDYRKLCDRLIRDFTRDPEYRGTLAYVSPAEVESSKQDEESRANKLKAQPKPRRRTGRPRIHPVDPLDYKACDSCSGAGFLLSR